MRSLLLSCLVAAALPGAGGRGRADTQAEALLARAIKAHGGEEALTRCKAVRRQLKVILPGPDKTPKVWEHLFLAPNKYKDVREGYYLGRKTASITVTDGKDVWTIVQGQLELQEGRFAERVRDDAHLVQVMRLVPLRGKEYELKAVGETKVDGKTAAGLLVRTKGHKDVTLYFGADSGLLVKAERPAYDIHTEQEVTEERFYQDYPKKADLPYARKVFVKVGGRNDISYEVTAVKFLQEAAEKEFRRR
jgi:hypothetical protein